MKKIKIELHQGRGSLGEGRKQGIGFGFLKKVAEDRFRGVQPISPCKDYLNDVLYTEVTGKAILAYGLSTKKQDILEDVAHIAVQVCPPGVGAPKHAGFDKELGFLTDNLGKIEAMINMIESMIGIKGKTELAMADENLVYAKLPIDWAGSTPAISLWAFMFRNFIYAADDDPFRALEKTKDSGDMMSAKLVIAKIKGFVKNGLPKQDMNKLDDPYSIHGCGIMRYEQ